MTIKEAQKKLRDGMDNGTTCPCCHQHVKMYKRVLNSSMAYGLIIMWKLHKEKGPSTYLKMNEEIAKLGIPSSNIEYPKLKYWGFVEEMPNDDDSKRTSGLWRMTSKGINFVNGITKVPSHVKVYNQLTYGFVGDYINIKQALRNKYDYYELMNN